MTSPVPASMSDEAYMLCRTDASVVTRQLTTFKLPTRQKSVVLPRGQTMTLGSVTGCGYVTQIWVTFDGWFWKNWDPSAPVSQTILKTLIMRIYWDGCEKPAIEAPVGDFFGGGLCQASNFASRYFSMSSGGFVCSFPMPFRKGFRIEFTNLDEHIDPYLHVNIMYQEVASLPADAGYFHAQFCTGHNEGPEPLEIMSVEGAGQYVGCTMSMQGKERNTLSFLEAPEYVYIDDDWQEPRIVGTGMEDYFLGGWYFREGEFVGPFHGVPYKNALDSTITMYRVHSADAIHFKRRLRFLFVTPWAPERVKPFRYSSVAYVYLNKPEGCGLPIPAREDLLCWYRTRDTDHQSIP